MNIATIALHLLLSSSAPSEAKPLTADQQITAAQQAAPPHITDNASYMVWTGTAFKTALKGDNGFTCLLLTDPHGRYEPSCLNKEAMRSVFPVYQLQTQMLYQGASYTEIQDLITEKFQAGELAAAGHGGIVYMMSPENKWYGYKNKKLYDVPPHLMLYFPTLSDEELGFTQSFGQPALSQEYPHLSTLIIMVPNTAK